MFESRNDATFDVRVHDEVRRPSCESQGFDFNNNLQTHLGLLHLAQKERVDFQ